MAWQFFITISILSGVSAVLVHRYLLHDTKHHPAGMAILTDFTSAVALALFALAIGETADWSLLPWGNVVLAFVLWSIVDYILNIAVKSNEASVFSILFSTRTFWTIFASLIFLNESFTLSDWAGTLLMSGAVLLVLTEKKLSWNSHAIWYGLATAFFMGMALTNDGIVLEVDFSVPTYFAITFLAPSVVLTIVSKQGRRAAVKFARGTKRKWILALGLLHAISAAGLYYAYKQDQALSALASLNQSQTILAAVGAIIILKERDHIWRRISAALISFVGVLLIVL